MRILRIVATLVTGTTMLLGGTALTLVGPPLVVALGIAIAVVGVGYLYAELSADRAMRELAEVRFQPVETDSRSDVRTAPASARKTAPASSS